MVNHLIRSPDFPKEQTYDHDEAKWIYSYESGETFDIEADTQHAVWIGPTFGPKKLSFELVRTIDATQADHRDTNFDSAEDLLDHVRAMIVK